MNGTNMLPQDWMHGQPLVRRGLHLLGLAIGIAMTWFIAAWIIHGSQPLDTLTPVARLGQGTVRCSVGEVVYQAPILPSAWLLAMLALLTLAAFAMMFVGSQDINRRLRKNTPEPRTPNPET